MTQFTQAEIEIALMAVVAWAGNASKASQALKAEGKVDVSSQTLNVWRRETHAQRYEQLREKYSEQMELQVIGEMRDLIRHTLDVERKAVERAQERLESNRDQDPSRTAANLATLVDKTAGKMLTLQGRPSSIREDRRDPEQILRALAAKGVIELPSGDVQEDAGGDG